VGLELASQYRHLFPVLENVTYLNSCSQGALAIPVRDALNEYLDGMYEKGSLWDQWVMKQEELRDLVAKAFVTKRSNVAITTTASTGINSVLSSFDFSGSKKRIVTTDLEFPTMGQILHAQERRGAEVIHVKSNQEGLLDLEEFEAALDERVALVAATHVCYRHGAMTDIKAITEIAHKRDIPVLVDAYQSAGSMPINFDEIGADFMVGGFLKYMLGIPGIGFLLAKENSHLIPTKTGWFAARNVFAMDINSYEPALDARRFEEGTPPIPSVYAAVAGLKLLLEVGLESVWTQNQSLYNTLRQGFESQDLDIKTPPQAGLHGVMIAIAATNEQKAVASLEESGVIVSSRGGNVRISPHFYNDASDVDELMRAVLGARELFS
jgi:selenocysteine lyase/cysteine desulfurase